MTEPPVATERARTLLARLDLTHLVPNESKQVLAGFCRRAKTPFGTPAAICVLPENVTTACETLAADGVRSTVRVATVANFPVGDQVLADVERSIDYSLDAGADEIDAVLPWRSLLDGDTGTCSDLLASARKRCDGTVLKVILETGALPVAIIETAADLALDHGADFLKTSTGLGPPGASLDATAVLLDRIQARGAPCGLKVSGGIRTPVQADLYLRQAEARMGVSWPSNQRFRIGASGLLDGLLQLLSAQ